MGTKIYKPTTPSRRWMTGHDFSDISREGPQRSLLSPLKKSGGRNNSGRVTVRHVGGGHKRMSLLKSTRRYILLCPPQCWE